MHALEGIKVLDWTCWQLGPIATCFLGDLGADVIKIEERSKGDGARGINRLKGLPTDIGQGRTFHFEYLNRNKRSIALDLRKPGGREAIYRLVPQVDVFVQNFRCGVAEQAGLGYDTLSRYNPKLVYASACGWGAKGPDSKDPALDYLGLARSGIMFSAGEPQMPPIEIIGAITDQMAGIVLAYGILAALITRDRHGIGQEVDTSHLGSMIALQGISVAAASMLGKDLPRTERRKAPNPLYNHYPCAEDTWIALGHLQSERYWPPFVRAIGHPELEHDGRFSTMEARQEHAEALVVIFDALFQTRTADQWIAHFKAAGDFLCARVNRIGDLLNDPQVLANDYVVEFDHPVLGKIREPGIPVRFSRTPGAIREPAPEVGQHTEEVLMEMGYSWEEIEHLQALEVI